MQRNERYHRKVLLNGFYLNEYTLRSRQQTHKLKSTLYSLLNKTGKYCFHLNDCTLGFRSQTQKLEAGYDCTFWASKYLVPFQMKATP